MSWIYDKKAKIYDWYAFKKDFYISECEDIILKIASMGEYAVFINGKDIARGPVRSFDTCKLYDQIDVSMHLTNGKNTILILSLKLENGGINAQILQKNTLICQTDESWKMKKYNAFEENTYCNCPPLEPVRRCEEHFNANIDSDFFDDEIDNNWEQSDMITFNEVKTENSVGESASENIVLPKRVISLLSSNDRKGFGFRLKNPNRKSNPVTKGNLDIFILAVNSDENFKSKFVIESGTLYLNGEKTVNSVNKKKAKIVLYQRFQIFIGESYRKRKNAD